MDIFDCINKRRSIRKYKDKEVENDKIDLLIKAAMAAPSALVWFILDTQMKKKDKEVNIMKIGYTTSNMISLENIGQDLKT